MQQIARELNLSETVFLLKPATSEAVAKARIFTPYRELDFAGHPTVGSAYVLREAKNAPARFAIEENVGLVPIETDTDSDGQHVFWLTTPGLSFFETMDAAFCARLLNVDIDDIAADCPPQFASAGSPFLFVCLNSPEAVDRAQIQHSHLAQASGNVNSVGTFIYSRMFAPHTGIPEDPATGGATGPLAGYMLRHGKLPKQTLQFTSEQGVKMGRRSLLHVKIDINGNDASIKVGGSVVPVAEGVFFLDA
jgi:trans-2,3-dihydro-3-hydroxyanthranilate isomerase